MPKITLTLTPRIFLGTHVWKGKQNLDSGLIRLFPYDEAVVGLDKGVYCLPDRDLPDPISSKWNDIAQP